MIVVPSLPPSHRRIVSPRSSDPRESGIAVMIGTGCPMRWCTPCKPACGPRTWLMRTRIRLRTPTCTRDRAGRYVCAGATRMYLNLDVENRPIVCACMCGIPVICACMNTQGRWCSWHCICNCTASSTAFSICACGSERVSGWTPARGRNSQYHYMCMHKYTNRWS